MATQDYVIITPEKMDANSFGFTKTRDNQYGGKMTGLVYNDQRFYLKFRGKAPFGIGTKMNDTGYNIQINVTDENIQKAFEEFDAYILKNGQTHYTNWGIPVNKTKGKSNSVHIAEMYKSTLKFPMIKKNKGTPDEELVVNPDYPAYIQASIPTKKDQPNVFACDFFDSNGNQITEMEFMSTEERKTAKGRSVCDAVPNMSEVTLLLRASSVWGGPQGFGVSWQVAQARVYPPVALPKGKWVGDDDNDDDDDSENVRPSGNLLADDDAPTTQKTDDEVEKTTDDVTSDDEVVEAEAEPVPEPEPVKPRRVLRPRRT